MLVCSFNCFFRLQIYEAIAAIFWQSASYVCFSLCCFSLCSVFIFSLAFPFFSCSSLSFHILSVFCLFLPVFLFCFSFLFYFFQFCWSSVLSFLFRLLCTLHVFSIPFLLFFFCRSFSQSFFFRSPLISL